MRLKPRAHCCSPSSYSPKGAVTDSSLGVPCSAVATDAAFVVAATGSVPGCTNSVRPCFPPSFSPYRGMARPTYIRTCLMLAGAPACRPLAGGSESHHRLHRVQRLRAGGIDCQRRGKALGTLSMRTTLFPRLVVASIEYTDLEPEELIIKEGFPRRSEVVGDTNPYSHASSVAPSNVETSIPTNGL